jgi:hypothetical protein
MAFWRFTSWASSPSCGGGRHKTQNGSFSISVRAATASRDIIRQSARICRHANRVPLVLLRHDNHVAFIQQSAAGRLCLNGYVSNPVPCSESRFVQVELKAVEIDAFVEWGYLEPKDREDICAIEQAANAFDSGRPEIAGRPGIAVKVRKV